MHIEFREINPFDLWLWFEFENVPSVVEQQYVEGLLDSWFMLGKLGAFNAENLQVQDAGLELSYLTYDHTTSDENLMSLMHNMGEPEYQGTWGRCWFDLGTSDAIALDMLINALRQLDKEYLILQRLIVGGENEDWPIPGNRKELFYDENDWN